MEIGIQGNIKIWKYGTREIGNYEVWKYGNTGIWKSGNMEV